MSSTRFIAVTGTLFLTSCTFFGSGTGSTSSESSGEVILYAAAMLAGETLDALKNKNMDKLSSLAHPQKGIRFTPYTHVHPETDVVLLPAELRNAFDDSIVHEWGFEDGSGEPIEKTFAEYFARYVWRADFTAATEVNWNRAQDRGNSLDNAAEVYPDAQIVEYHIPGTNPNYGGMDWQSLRLALEKEGDAWFVTGIIYDQWTI